MSVRATTKANLKGKKFKKSYLIHLLTDEHQSTILFARPSLGPVKIDKNRYYYNPKVAIQLRELMRHVGSSQMKANPRIMSWVWATAADYDLNMNV